LAAKKITRNSLKEWQAYLKSDLIEDPKNLQVQYLLYVPKDQRSNSVDPTEDKPFYTFKELRTKAEGKQKEILKNIKKYDNAQAKMRRTPNNEQLHTVVNLLHFNKIQKMSYKHEAKTARDSLITSVLTKEEEEILKRKRMPPIRAFTLLNHPGRKSQQNAPSQDEPNTVKAMLSDAEALSGGQALIDEGGKEAEANESPVSYIYKFDWKFRVRDKGELRPKTREGHSLTLVGKKLILYGGFNNFCLTDIFTFDTTMQRWMKPDVNGEVPLEGRQGHSANADKKSLVVFGGQKDYNHELRYRECLNDVRIFSPYKNSWIKLRTKGGEIEARRNHASAIYDRTLYIYGGITTEGHFLRDLWSLNLKTNAWQKHIIENNKDPGVAFHTMVACFEAKELRAFKEGDLMNTTVTQEGIYVFGGKDAEGQTLNSLKILTLTKTGALWKHPSIKGKFPAPRYGHSMLVYDNLGLIIVYGGRNDQLLNTGDCTDFNQISVLSLELMAWMTLSNTGSTLIMPRYNHAATIAGNTMIIFGGLEPESYSTDDLAITEISQVEFNRGQKLKKENKESETKKKKKRTKKQPDSSPTAADANSLKQRNMSAPNIGDVFSELKSRVSDNHSEIKQNNILSYLPLPRPEKLKEKYSISRSQSVIKRVIVEAKSFFKTRDRSLEVRKVGL